MLKLHYEVMPDEVRRDNDRINNEKGLDSPLLPGAVRRFKTVFCDIERALADSPWLVGNMFTLADISHVVYTSRMRSFQLGGLLDELPRLKDWQARIHARPSWAEAVEKWGDTSRSHARATRRRGLSGDQGDVGRGVRRPTRLTKRLGRPLFLRLRCLAHDRCNGAVELRPRLLDIGRERRPQNSFEGPKQRRADLIIVAIVDTITDMPQGKCFKHLDERGEIAKAPDRERKGIHQFLRLRIDIAPKQSPRIRRDRKQPIVEQPSCLQLAIHHLYKNQSDQIGLLGCHGWPLIIPADLNYPCAM